MSESQITPADLADAALAYRRSLDTAAQLVGIVDAELLEVRTRHHPTLEAAAADCEARREHLLALVGSARDRWAKGDKSDVTHGIRYGLRQAGGRWHWPKGSALLDLVRAKLAPSVQARVIKAVESVQVSKLTAKDRTLLGIPRDPVHDAPFAAEDKTDSIGRLMDLLGRAPPTDDPAPQAQEPT